jgi:hypothetical protein
MVVTLGGFRQWHSAKEVRGCLGINHWIWLDKNEKAFKIINHKINKNFKGHS